MPTPAPASSGTDRPTTTERNRQDPDDIYDQAPDNWANLDEVAAPGPIENAAEDTLYRHQSLEDVRSLERERTAQTTTESSGEDREAPYDQGPDNWANLDEVAAPGPVQNAAEGTLYRSQSLEQVRTLERERRASLSYDDNRVPPGQGGILSSESRPAEKRPSAAKYLVQLYTLSHLVFCSIFGTLARIGLSALTTYPGAPVTFGILWANVGGSLIMGFLMEDRMLFRHHDEVINGGQPRFNDQRRTRNKEDEESQTDSDRKAADLAAAKKAHLAVKKTVPLYIGLTTGFCGSFTSFSSFIADSFLAISNDLPTPGVSSAQTSRNGGYSFMALLAVIITTVCLSISALFVGAHLAIASSSITPSIRYHFLRRILDPLVAILGWGCWIGAVFLAIFPPHDFWRGRTVFALVFAPPGCLARFYLSLYLNAKILSFPLGTFCANILGTAVLGMSWDISHAQIGGIVGCQVLHGIEDGFCGCLTTISTWVAELTSLRRRHSYVYGTASVATALVLLIAIMGGLRWSHGFEPLLCSV